jgi:hypothetical protein
VTDEQVQANAEEETSTSPATPEDLPLLTREQIYETAPRTYEYCPVPQWKGQVRLQSLTADERDAFEKMIADVKSRRGRSEVRMKKNVSVRALLCVMSIVNEAGERLFRNTDMEWLGKKHAAAVDTIFERASLLSGLSEADVEELEEDLD